MDQQTRVSMAAIKVALAWWEARHKDVRLGRVSTETLLSMDDSVGRLMAELEEGDDQADNNQNK